MVVRGSACEAASCTCWPSTPQARHQAGRRLVRLIAGNPVTMGQMTRHLPAAGSYAPVTILIQELPGGGAQLGAVADGRERTGLKAMRAAGVGG
jgi:hypothetical protein